MNKLTVRGTEVSIQWNMERDDYISLPDIAKVKDSDNPQTHYLELHLNMLEVRYGNHSNPSL